MQVKSNIDGLVSEYSALRDQLTIQQTCNKVFLFICAESEHQGVSISDVIEEHLKGVMLVMESIGSTKSLKEYLATIELRGF